MKLVLLSLLTVVAVVCEPILGAAIGNPSLRPDIVLIPIVAAIAACPGPAAVFSAALIGLICDCLTGPHLGPQMAAFGLIAAVGSVISLRPKSIVDVFLLSFACVFLARTAALAVCLLFNAQPFGTGSFGTGSFGTGSFSAGSTAGQIASTSFVTALSLITILLLVRRVAKPFVRHSWVAKTRIATLGWSRATD